MRTLTQGADPKLWWVGVPWRCDRCGHVFELEASDKEAVTDASLPYTLQAQVDCPNCKGRVLKALNVSGDV